MDVINDGRCPICLQTKLAGMRVVLNVSGFEHTFNHWLHLDGPIKWCMLYVWVMNVDIHWVKDWFSKHYLEHNIIALNNTSETTKIKILQLLNCKVKTYYIQRLKQRIIIQLINGCNIVTHNRCPSGKPVTFFYYCGQGLDENDNVSKCWCHNFFQNGRSTTTNKCRQKTFSTHDTFINNTHYKRDGCTDDRKLLLIAISCFVIYVAVHELLAVFDII